MITWTVYVWRKFIHLLISLKYLPQGMKLIGLNISHSKLVNKHTGVPASIRINKNFFYYWKPISSASVLYIRQSESFFRAAVLRVFPIGVDKQGVLPSLCSQSRRCSRAESARGAERKAKISLNVDWWWEWRGSSPWAWQTKQEKKGGAGPRNRIMSTISYGLCLTK